MSMLPESEAQRLQREADNFTKKYEHEKKQEIAIILMLYRRLMILDDQIKQANQELQEAQLRLKKVRPPTAEMSRDIRRISIMENKLEQGLLRYSELQALNRSYRT